LKESDVLRIFLTGLPGSGKSTVLLKVIERLRSEGLRIGGFITPDVRVGGRRVAFKVVDLHSGEEAILASSRLETGPRVGQYRVDVPAFEGIALPALSYAEKECDLICVDEIGRMELFSQAFRRKIEELFNMEKPILAVVHRDYIRTYESRGTVLTVTLENRDALVEKVFEMMMEKL
jgi:nucleoside-triphosphatase